MSILDPLVNQPAEWSKATGPHSDIVVSSRIRLARNLAGFPFEQRLTPAQRDEVIGVVKKAVEGSTWLKQAMFLTSHDLEELDRQFLLERHLISREHASEEGTKAVVVTHNEVVSLMVLEEDHLRLQAFQSGFNLLETWRIVTEIDDELEKSLNFSFNSNLGYLTACPTNVGTGLRASCMLHLPGLVMTKQAQKVLQALSKLNLAVRGLYGEGTQATGNFFQFSNQITLGQREEEIIDNLECVIRQVIEHEKEARSYLKEKKKVKYEDQVWRALGVLKAARVMSSQEATQLISLLQLGVCQGLIQGKVTVQALNALFLLVQPAHLQKASKKTLTTTDRDVKRADLIRAQLKDLEL